MSSAVKAVRWLLANNPDLTAAVPSDRIVVGRLERGTALPAIAVGHVSTIRRKVVKQASTEFCTSRVQVTIFAKSYPDQDTVQKLVRKAMPSTRGAINGVDVDDVQASSDGPDIRDDVADIYMGSSDFIVTFNE